MTYGEYMKGVVQGEKNILFVNMAWGLGLGIIIDGNLYYGKSGFSGELGHFCMFENEVLCHCGKKGCLETEASGSAFHRILMERYREGSNTILAGKLDSGEEISLGDLLEAVRKEDVLCIDILEKTGRKFRKRYCRADEHLQSGTGHTGTEHFHWQASISVCRSRAPSVIFA